MDGKLRDEICLELRLFLPSLELQGVSRKYRQGALNQFSTEGFLAVLQTLCYIKA